MGQIYTLGNLGGGGGAVTSVNGLTGAVVLDSGDVGAIQYTWGPTLPVAPNPGDEHLLDSDGFVYKWLWNGVSGSWVLFDPAAGTSVTIQDGGVSIGTRPILNFIEGSNVTLTVADDVPNDRVNVTIASSGGGGGSPAGSDTWVQYNDSGSFGASAKFTFDEAEALIFFGEPDQSGGILGAFGTALIPNGANISFEGGSGFDDGVGGDAVGGNFTASGGRGYGTERGGNLSFDGGNAIDGDGGSVGINGGNSNASPGNVSLRAGLVALEGSGASVSITATDGVADTNPDQNGGNVTITVGLATGSGTPGNLIVVNLPTSDPGVSGALWIDTGNILKVSP